MTTTELHDLLREAKRLLPRCGTTKYPCDCMVCKVKVGIQAALAEPISPCVSCVKLREDLHEADEAHYLADIRLKEVIELVGEGGDGTAFGSVEAMIATSDHLQKLWLKQRDEARAEVNRLRALLNIKSDSSDVA